MKAWIRQLRQTLEDQIKTWNSLVEGGEEKKSPDLRVVTVSRQAGTGGKLIAMRVAQTLGLRLYDRNIIQKVADHAHTDADVVKSRDEKGGSILEDWMNTLVRQRYFIPEKYLQHLNLWPNEYLGHLEKVISEIAKNEGGVIVGRGANFLLPASICLRVRIVAPLQRRVDNIAAIFEVDPKVAKRRILGRENKRRAFVKHYFRADIEDPQYYDLVLNLDQFSLEQAAEEIVDCWHRFKGTNRSE